MVLKDTFRWTILALVVLASRRADAAEPPTQAIHDAMTRQAAAGDKLWRQIAESAPPATMGCRQLLADSLALCEVRQHPERLQRLFALARTMQDANPASPTYGNLRWSWRDAGVTDTNAVEFVMQDAQMIWIRHRSWLPEPGRKELERLLVLGVEGCIRHKVLSNYTNIALLNAANLIVLGETFNRPAAAAEGCHRLDSVCLWTASYGTHEFCSPTYYGVDLNGLLFLVANARGERQRAQSKALLELIWTDITLNWYSPAERLAGCHSRTYDYLGGTGLLNWYVWLRGGLSAEVPKVSVEPQGEEWSPPESLVQQSLHRFPRLVRQSWGARSVESRTHMLYSDVTLSCCGAAYASQDTLLSVDLPGGWRAPRCYFIPDGRDDPYGQKAFESGEARHKKALHLTPFWAGAQSTCDAIGLVLYRPKDFDHPEVGNVQSHFVMRRDVDGFWLNGKRLEIPAGTAAAPRQISIRVGEPLVFRKGTAAVGVRLLWASARDGRPAPAAIVDDGNHLGCLRLSVEHGAKSAAGKMAEAPLPGAALWVRVGSGLATDQAFDAWSAAFAAAQPAAPQIAIGRLKFDVPGVDGPVSVQAEGPFDTQGRVRLVPEPCRGVLELDGQEIGRPLLAAVVPATLQNLNTKLELR